MRGEGENAKHIHMFATGHPQRWHVATIQQHFNS